MSEYENQIILCLGRKRSGKNQLLWDLYTSKAPRVITIGLIPQDLARDPDVVIARGWSELSTTLEAASAYDRWHIATALEPEDLARLCALLAPPIGSSQRSLAAELGGVAIECGETYELFPNGRTPPEILALPRRGRHSEIDLFLATQRTAGIDREITYHADFIYAFAQQEKRDIDYLRENVSAPVAERVRRLRLSDYACVRYDKDNQVAQLLDRDRNEVGPPLTDLPDDQEAGLTARPPGRPAGRSAGRKAAS